MPNTYASPLNEADLDVLTDLARKGNALCGDVRLAPMYCAADGGDGTQPHAWLFVCWPAQNPAAARAGRRLLDALAHIAAEELGAAMQPTDPVEDRG
jgi:hypothetical protein